MRLRHGHDSGRSEGRPEKAGQECGDPKSYVGIVQSLAFVRVSSCPHFNLVCSWAAVLVLVTLAAEVSASTEYGKFGTSAKFTVPPRVGWWLMELPVTVTFVYFFFVKGGSQSRELVPRLCAAVMCLHYTYRGWIYPFLIRAHPGAGSNFSLLPAVGGWMVTITHGYLNAKWFAEHGTHLQKAWLRDPRFILGVSLYLTGFVSLVYHDHLMRELRSTPGPRYRIPTGGLFDYATQAVYFCELWTWLGFSLMSSGPNGVSAHQLAAYLPAYSSGWLPMRGSRRADTEAGRQGKVELCVRVRAKVCVSTVRLAWYLQKFGAEYSQLGRTYLVPFVW